MRSEERFTPERGLEIKKKYKERMEMKKEVVKAVIGYECSQKVSKTTL